MSDTPGKSRRNHVCSFCSKLFSKKEHLTRHLRSHTREKPFACESCGKLFGRNDTLTRHIRARHSSINHVETPRTSSTRAPGNSVAEAVSVSPSSRPPIHYASGQNLYARHSVVDLSQSRPTYPQNNPLNQNHFEESVGLLHGSKTVHPATLTTLNASSTDASHDYYETFCNTYWDSEFSEWLRGEDFTFDFDSSALDPALLFSPGRFQEDLSGSNAVNMENNPPDPTDAAPLHKEDFLRKQWFSFVGSDESGYSTPDVEAEQTQIDERFREDLHQRLHPPVPSTALPPTDFLNLCVRMYFTRFNPIFPIIHVPTFQLSKKNTLLLMSICTVGSLFLGSRAATLGQKIFDRLNKAALVSWQKYVSRGTETALAIIQAALIGHTYAMLSGTPTNLLTMQSFHGTVIAWARTCGVFQQSQTIDISYDTSVQDLEDVWKSWAKIEEKARAAAALYIHDTEYSALVNTEPFLRHSVSKVPSMCSADSWKAATTQEWRMTMNDTPSSVNAVQNFSSTNSPTIISISGDREKPDPFGIYAELERISASISEGKKLDTWTSISGHVESTLLRFHESHLQSNANAADDHYGMEILWHSAFIQLDADLNRLEMSSGRDGYEKSRLHLDYVKSWASSNSGARCAVHGALILQKSEKISFGANLAIHVPRVLYWAALVWYCFLEFGQAHTGRVSSERIEFAELQVLGVNTQQLLRDEAWSENQQPTVMTSRTLHGLVDLLGRIGNGGLSRKLASLMVSLVDRDIEA